MPTSDSAQPTAQTATQPAELSATVGAQATFEVTTPALLSLQMVAANDDGHGLTAVLDGVSVPVEEIRGPEQYARQHLIRSGTGQLTISYQATVRPGSPSESRRPPPAGTDMPPGGDERALRGVNPTCIDVAQASGLPVALEFRRSSWAQVDRATTLAQPFLFATESRADLRRWSR